MHIQEKVYNPGSFYELMPHQIRSILLVSTLYDAYITEKDGMLAEQICDRFLELNLIFIPWVTRVSTFHEALAALDSKEFDLVITMLDLPDADAFKLTEMIKKKNPKLPVVLLLGDPSCLPFITAPKKKSILDAIFSWSGDPVLFFSLIQCIEDRLNVEHDIATGLVKIVLVIDDSIKYYSTILPVIYGEIMHQTHRLIKEGLNEVQKLMQMRTRPKILLVSHFEDALEIFDKYKKDILGIISDISFPKEDRLLETAGLDFAKYVKGQFFDLPFILMSADPKNRSLAGELGISYANKNSPTFHSDLKNFIVENMGFGDFIFKFPDGKEVIVIDSKGEEKIVKASSLKDLQKCIEFVPGESLVYHSSRNHISIWLTARGKYNIALKMRPVQVSDFGGKAELIREYLIENIASYREQEQTGVVVKYHPGNWDSEFIQIGKGSIGGKARGIAFINYLLATTSLRDKFKTVRLQIPKTVAISVEEFDKFIDENRLQKVVIMNDDRAIGEAFVNSNLSSTLQESLLDFVENCNLPLAVRSSSLLEDSQFLPFAGIYSTYMLPNNHPDVQVRLGHLMRAIKLVYASVFSKCSKSYISSTPYKISEEKMGIVIQQIVGQRYGDEFYPAFSGVAKSYNYYPFSHMKQEEGVAQIALGLGRLVIEGGNALRFSPVYPEIIPQFSSISDIFKSSQKYFYALNLNSDAGNMFLDDSANLDSLKIDQAEKDILNVISSVYDIQDQAVKEDIFCKGPKIITFANILKYNIFPLAQILVELLNLLKTSMGKEIEIEFAVNLFKDKKVKASIDLLQVRPLVVNKEGIEITEEDRKRENMICRCKKTLGNGMSNVHDVVFVEPDKFDSAKTRQISAEVEKINSILHEQNRPYLLIGMGRWGTADPWLGIPVNWDQISNVEAIVETSIGNFFFEPSQGSHFFQNITARGVGYFSIPSNGTEEFIDWEYLKSLPAIHRLHFVSHIRTQSPIMIKINGKTGEGIIGKFMHSLCNHCDKGKSCKFRKNRIRVWNCEEYE